MISSGVPAGAPRSCAWAGRWSQRGRKSPQGWSGKDMPITLLDGILVGFTLVSAMLAMVRGFSREILSIASWIAAAATAFFLYPTVLPYVQPHVDSEKL